MSESKDRRRNRESIAANIWRCVCSHAPTSCLLGNVTALEFAEVLAPMFTACPTCGSEPGCNIDCKDCHVLAVILVGPSAEVLPDAAAGKVEP